MTALTEIEACPRRWALGAAEYPTVWDGRGYPPPLQLNALAGTAVHLVLETITRELVRAGCSSVLDPTAVLVMKTLGGYSRLLDECIGRLLLRLANNPRAAPLLETAARSLRGRTPELRARAQSILSRVRLSPCAGTHARSGDRKVRPRSPLKAGVYPEVELRAPRIAWKGKADLLVISGDGCEITDFKAGAYHERHRFQTRVYALLWSRDSELNPDGRLAERIFLRYEKGDVEILAPTASELADLERDIVSRRDAAHRAITQHPPEAHPSAANCGFCGVRHLCDKYWTVAVQRSIAAEVGGRSVADVLLTITGRHGPSSWDGLIEVANSVGKGQPAVVRTKGDVQFQPGSRVLMLDVAVAVEVETEVSLAVITLGTLSEAYTVSEDASV